jgi:SAM-dependent methyltransferase
MAAGGGILHPRMEKPHKPGGVMPDVYAHITEADEATLDVVAAAMELRATDPRQQEILATYLARIDWPPVARVVEIGCGTGAITRALAARPTVSEVVGVEPSPGLVKRARKLAAALPTVSFIEADGRDVPLPEGSFDVVVVHTVLSHVPGPERVVAEAFRLLRSGGWAAFFDGDYATMTVARAADDPLQACASAFAEHYINDAWVMRRLPRVAVDAGFADPVIDSHGYLGVDDAPYLRSIVARGAEALLASGVIARSVVAALNDETERRVTAGEFFGFIGYISLIVRKPDGQANNS